MLPVNISIIVGHRGILEAQKDFFSIMANMKLGQQNVGFIGFGHMAKIIFRACERAKILPKSNYHFIQKDPAKMKRSEQEFGITSTSFNHLVDTCQILLICVRPNHAQFVLEDLKSRGVGDKMIISVMAGIKCAFLQKFIPQAQVLRVMPNICSEVGEGMTSFAFGTHSTTEFRSFAHLLFGSMGEVIEVGENLMDISTAIGGSGPGLVIQLIEAMAREGEKEGLSYAKSLKMAAQVFRGASSLILKGGQPEDLLTQMSTPKGTTEAGLNALREKQVDRNLKAAVEASMRRSKEIASEYY